MGKHGVFGATRVQLPHLCYLGGETITNPDNWKVPLPTVPTIVQVASEGGECFYAMNGNFAQHNSPGRIAQDAEQFIGPMSNMETLHIHAPAGIVHLQYWHECGHGRNERAAFQYYERVLNLDPIAYWPLWETSGTTAECLVNPAQNGTYSSDVSTWPVGTGIGDGNSAPGFDGTNDWVEGITATIAAAWNGSEGTLFHWLKVANVGVWTDGVRRDTMFFQVDGSNYVMIRRSTANNTMQWLYNAGGTLEVVGTAGLSSTAWVPVALTWSKSAEEMKAYWNGAQTGATQTTLGVWAGTIGAANIGATGVGPANPWSGWLAHAAVWDRALTQPDINSLATA